MADERSEPDATWADVLTAATAYRSLVVWFGLSYVAAIPARVVGESLLAIPLTLLWLAVNIVMLVYVFRLAAAIGWSAPWLWVILMFFPCINIIVLLVLSQRANEWMKACGVKVGLLGPTPTAIAEVRGKAEAERGGAPPEA